MNSAVNDRYFEASVLNAGPMELVRLMLRACVGSVQQARLHLSTGEIAERGRQIGKSVAILTELISSLDHESAPDYSRNVLALYVYIESRVTEGHLQQHDGPLAEAEGLLETLASAWEQTTGAAAPEANVPGYLAAPAESLTHAWTA